MNVRRRLLLALATSMIVPATALAQGFDESPMPVAQPTNGSNAVTHYADSNGTAHNDPTVIRAVPAATTYGAAAQEHLQFDPQAYLQSTSQAYQRHTPLASGAQPVAPNTEVFNGPYNTGSFGGYVPNAKAEGRLKFQEKYDPSKSPEWVNDKLKMRYFQDNTEHQGNADPMGFF